MIRYVVTVTVLVGAAAVWAGTSIPFDPFQGIVEVEVEIDGRAKGRFGIDTGADRFYIDKAFAEKHELNLIDGPPQRAVVGIEGSSEAQQVAVRSLAIGEERLYNLDATAIDLRALIKDPRADVPDGLIGYEVLRRFYVTVDYGNKRMTLDDTEPSFVGDGLQQVPFETKRHLIMVDVTFNDSVTVPMALDYCASFVFVTPELAGRIGVDAGAERPQVPKMSLGGVMTSSDVYTGISDLGNLRKSLKGVEIHGLIGASFLYQHTITIDYRRSVIWVRE